MALTRQIGATNGPAGRSRLLVAYISKYGWATTLVLHMTFVSLWLISFIDYVLTGFVLWHLPLRLDDQFCLLHL